MYDEFFVESTNFHLVGRLWIMPKGRDIIQVSSHCGARGYDNVRQEDMFITVDGVAVRFAVTVRRDDKGDWSVDRQCTYLNRLGDDVSGADGELIEKVSRAVAAQFAEKRQDKMLASEIVSIESDKRSKESELTRLEEQASGVREDIETLVNRLTEVQSNVG